MVFNPNVTQRIVTRAKRRIVRDWRSRLRDFSTISLGLVTVLGPAMVSGWNLMPEKWQAAVPQQAILIVVGVYTALGAWGAIGKFIIQGPLPEEKADAGK